eukprot:jgi/Ulvmu1/7231/UM035_0018.1
MHARHITSNSAATRDGLSQQVQQTKRPVSISCVCTASDAPLTTGLASLPQIRTHAHHIVQCIRFANSRVRVSTSGSCRLLQSPRGLVAPASGAVQPAPYVATKNRRASRQTPPGIVNSTPVIIATWPRVAGERLGGYAVG